MMKIGVIGEGFVGGTLLKVLRPLVSSQPEKYSVCSYDIDPSKGHNTIKHFKDVCCADLIFVCLPTPMIQETGECYTGIVEDTIKTIRTATPSPIIIKSTVPPQTTQRWFEQYGRVHFNPEFLTEANALNDFISSEYQILGLGGGDVEVISLFGQLFLSLSDLEIMPYHEQVYAIGSTMAELVKYTRNCYLATRISFFSEIQQICDASGVDFNDMKHFVGLDHRVGSHYNNIKSENPSFGGHCLPKDLNSLIFLAKQLGVDPKVLSAVWAKNLERCTFRDWENQTNRAVISLKK